MDMSTLELGNYFSPWYAEHIGQIRVASGNRTVDTWASKKLRVHYYIFTYPSLLKLHGDASLLKTLDGLLGNEALLQLQLKTLSPAFKLPREKFWFEEMIDNYLKLWENNMWSRIDYSHAAESFIVVRNSWTRGEGHNRAISGMPREYIVIILIIKWWLIQSVVGIMCSLLWKVLLVKWFVVKCSYYGNFIVNNANAKLHNFCV